jgi:hypothetical protein
LVGLMVFGNGLKAVPVPARVWTISSLHACATPPERARICARCAPDALAPCDRPERWLFRNSEQDLTSAVQTVAKTGGCERYVVVVKFASQFSTTNQTVSGIGAMNYAGVKTYLFALTYVRIYDGRSFAILKKGPGGESYVPFSGLFGGTGIRGPSREMKGLSWPPTPDTMTRLRDDARSLLAESQEKAMPELLAP